MGRYILLAFLFCSFFSLTATVRAAELDGAEELSSSDWYRGRSRGAWITCGKIGGAWIPGRGSNGAFLSHVRRISNLQLMALNQRGKRKRSVISRVKAFRALHRKEGAFCSARNENSPAPGGSTAIRFRSLQGAVGLALKSTANVSLSTSGAASNLFMVSSTGALEQVLDQGQATISRMLIAPNNKIYVLFQNRINLESGSIDYSGGCLLAEVSADSGVPTCVDNELASVNWGNWGWNQFKNRPVQFDGQGAVYYWGYTTTGTSVLRRYHNGITESLITDNVYPTDYYVRPDGSVLLSGTTVSTQTGWVRHLGTDRALRTINSSSASFLSVFPDGNAYFGVWGSSFMGIKRFSLDTLTLDPKPWVSTWYDGWSTEIAPYYNTVALDYCQYPAGNNQPFCQSAGAQINALERTTNQKVFAISHYNENRRLMQYAPQIDQVPTLVTTPTLLKSLLNHLFIAGTDSSLTSRLTMFDTETSTEFDLLQGNQIEVYRMGTVNQSLLFDGLNFANNQYVIGAVNLQTMDLVFSSTGDSRLVDFEIFSH